MAEWDASHDGSHVVYAVQRGGVDWREIRVLEVATGETLDDRVEWARFGAVSWAKDGTGFFYSRYPEPEPVRRLRPPSPITPSTSIALEHRKPTTGWSMPRRIAPICCTSRASPRTDNF